MSTANNPPVRSGPKKTEALPSYTLSQYIRSRQTEEYRGTKLGPDFSHLPHRNSETCPQCLANILSRQTGHSADHLPSCGEMKAPHPRPTFRESASEGDIDFAWGFLPTS
ncbi:hypothetical protein PAPYR_6202 [Paratrimastix pyriformis]|uniref:Uncharacterized protein n=1 Tax=Paratrimastix pyriformis TaxID=342808 RepID=A0ABQ8UI59_9EUKA|nr:hypothetical protein PAPYR_6202 [Paratrimastix pyriformis]